MEKAIKEKRITELRAVNDDKKMVVEGYAVVFDKLANLGYVNEKINKRALDNCDMKDVCFNYNHGQNGLLILARTRNNSLQLQKDDKGLKIRAELIDTQQNRDLYKSIQAGLLDKMSFAFTVKNDNYNSETNTREIMNIDKLYDVSVVDNPAYEETEIYTRSKKIFDDKRKNEKLQLEKEKILLKYKYDD